VNRWGIIVFTLFAAAAKRVDGAPSCAADCARRMAECRETRCAGVSRRACRDTCRAVTGCAAGGARIHTLATVVTECREGPAGFTGAQRLDIRRGDCAPVTVLKTESAASMPNTGLCALFGQFRAGGASQIIGVFQRVGVSPDGRTVVFEVNHDYAYLQSSLVVPEEGIYSVHADGTAMRRLGPPSRAPNFKVVPSDTPLGFGVDRWDDIWFSSDGRFVVFTDRGPGADGSDAVQVVAMDVESGARTQLTHFVAASRDPTIVGAEAGGYFLDKDTLLVWERPNASSSDYSNFTVKKDGSDLRPFSYPKLVPIQGARILPIFQVLGQPRSAFTVGLPMATTEPLPGYVSEVFVEAGKNILQLTSFGRSDTDRGAIRNRAGNVFFFASADPFGRNPSHTCQLFLIGSSGNHLRQITSFGLPGPPVAGASGCTLPATPPTRCSIEIEGPATFDATADVLTFDTTCDPFGTNPIGSQFFAVRGDGSGLRQLTNYRGMQVEPDGTVTVELPGPTEFPGRIR
jgi:hypothetical protein